LKWTKSTSLEAPSFRVG